MGKAHRHGWQAVRCSTLRLQSVNQRVGGPPELLEENSLRARVRRSVHRVGLGRPRVSPDCWALMAIMVAVLLANLPYLFGLFDPNPLGTRSGLATSVVHGWLAGKATIDPNVGFSSQAIGHLAALDLLHLHLPWWNPYEVTGMPLVGETQAAGLFPLTLLTALSNGQLYEHMLLELVGGVCTYLLLRRVLIARWVAATCDVAFALNGTFAWFAHAAVNPVPFLPMLLLGIERAFAATRTGRTGGWRLLALAGALSVYAGFPEVAYIDALLGVCWIGWRCRCLERRQVSTFVVKAALGGAAGALLAAPVVIATSGYLGHADVGQHATGQLGAEHLSGSALPQLLMPYIYGPINGDPRVATWLMVGGYLSMLLVLLAGIGVFARGRFGLRAVMVGWGVLVFARMYGKPPVLGHVIGALPAMSKIEFFRYAWPSLGLSVVVLAALGLDDLARVPEHRWRLLWGAMAVTAFGVAAWLGALPLARSVGARYHAYFVASVASGAITLVTAAAVALLRGARARSFVLGALLIAEALGLFVVPEFSASRAQTVDLAPVAFLRRHLGESRFFTLGPIQPNYGSYFGLASLNVNDFVPQAYADYVHTRLDPVVNPTLFVGTYGGWRPLHGPSPELELMGHLNGYRAAAVRYVMAPAGEQLGQRSAAFRVVFRDATAWIYSLHGAASYFTAAGCGVSSRESTIAHLSCGRSATLVRRETWFPGWTAKIDGHSIAIRRAEKLFQAVTVPAGAHNVVFSYEPPGIAWAGVGLLAGCALLAAPTVSVCFARLRARGHRRTVGLPRSEHR